MTDKQRAEFVEKWAKHLIFEISGGDIDDREHEKRVTDFVVRLLVKMLLEYDKLNGDKLARLKEFVRTKAVSNTWELDGVPFSIEAIDVKTILAEIERLEEGR
jgi:hypothetical protein